MVTRVNPGSSVASSVEVTPTQRVSSAGLSDVSSTIQEAAGDVAAPAAGFCAWIGRMVSQLWEAIKRCICCRKEVIPHEARLAKGSGIIDSHFAQCQDRILRCGYTSFGMTVSIKYSNGTSSEVGNSGRAFSTAAGLDTFKQECRQSLQTLIEQDNNKGLNEGKLEIQTRLIARRPDRKFNIHSVDNSILFSNEEKGTLGISDQYGISQAELDEHHLLFFPERRGFEWSQI